MNITKKQQEVLKYIETQIDVKLKVREIKRKNYIPFEDSLKQNEMCRLNSLAASSGKFSIMPNGYKCLALTAYQ